jgi:hypothetical protein
MPVKLDSFQLNPKAAFCLAVSIPGFFQTTEFLTLVDLEHRLQATCLDRCPVVDIVPLLPSNTRMC